MIWHVFYFYMLFGIYVASVFYYNVTDIDNLYHDHYFYSRAQKSGTMPAQAFPNAAGALL